MKTRIIKFDIKPDETEAFKAAFKAAKIETDKEPGAVDIRLFEDNSNSTKFFAYESFKDETAMEWHGEQQYVATLFEYLGRSEAVGIPMFVSETSPAPVPPKSADPQDNVFIIFFIFKFKPEFKDQLLEQFEKHINQTRTEAGNLLFDLYTIDGVDDEMIVYEHWRKESDVWDVHFKQPYAVETGNLMGEAVIGELEQYMSFVTEVK